MPLDLDLMLWFILDIMYLILLLYLVPINQVEGHQVRRAATSPPSILQSSTAAASGALLSPRPTSGYGPSNSGRLPSNPSLASYDIIGGLEAARAGATTGRESDGSESGLASQVSAHNSSAAIQLIEKNASSIRRLLGTNGTLNADNTLKAANESALSPGYTATGYEQDIAAMNVLIGMLILANRRLVERRDKFLEQERLLVGARGRPSLPAADYSSQASQSAGRKQATAAQPNVNGTNLVLKDKDSSKWRLTEASSVLEARRSFAPKLDHVLVRPGFEGVHGPSGALTSGFHPQRSDPWLEVPLHTRPEVGALYSPAAGHRYESLALQHDPMLGHRPVEARDLLQVNWRAGRGPEPALSAYARGPGALHGNPFQPELAMSTAYDKRGPRNRPFGGPPGLFGQPAAPTHSPAAFRPRVVPTSASRVGLPFRSSVGTPAAPDNWVRPPLVAGPALEEQLRLRAFAEMEHQRRQHELRLRQRLQQPPPPAAGHALAHDAAPGAAVNPPDARDSADEQPANPPGEPEETEADSESESPKSRPEEEEEAVRELRQSLPGFGAPDDFTDLFPAGLLSDAEIKEMRREQQEQQQNSADSEERQDVGEDEAEQAGSADKGAQPAESPREDESAPSQAERPIRSKSGAQVASPATSGQPAATPPKEPASKGAAATSEDGQSQRQQQQQQQQQQTSAGKLKPEGSSNSEDPSQARLIASLLANPLPLVSQAAAAAAAMRRTNKTRRSHADASELAWLPAISLASQVDDQVARQEDAAATPPSSGNLSQLYTDNELAI